MTGISFKHGSSLWYFTSDSYNLSFYAWNNFKMWLESRQIFHTIVLWHTAGLTASVQVIVRWKKQAKCLFHTPARQPRTHSHHSADPSHTDALQCRIRVSHRLQTPPWRRWDRWKCLKWILFETSNCPALLKHVLWSDTLSHLRVCHFFL